MRTATKDNIDGIVKALKSGEHVGKIIFVNRYDGIDLPGDACRMLVIDGLPPLNSIKDRYIQSVAHPSKFVDVVASPDENMRVMTEEELTCFRKNIRDFYSALCHNGSISDISKINELLSIYKLRKDDIVNRYTVKFERQK